jgi:hypothetical protein
MLNSVGQSICPIVLYVLNYTFPKENANRLEQKDANNDKRNNETWQIGRILQRFKHVHFFYLQNDATLYSDCTDKINSSQ